MSQASMIAALPFKGKDSRNFARMAHVHNMAVGMKGRHSMLNYTCIVTMLMSTSAPVP
jgi:hypothetical protein